MPRSKKIVIVIDSWAEGNGAIVVTDDVVLEPGRLMGRDRSAAAV